MTPPVRGAALLMALLLMALVSTLAAAAWSWQWRAWAIERAEREHQQAAWLLTGALDWARLIVREDGRASSLDHLGEPWAVPLQPTPLSAFLRPGRDSADDPLEHTWLAGRIEDAQGRLNWRNLIDLTGAKPRLAPVALAAFERLYGLLDLPADELRSVAEALLAAWPADGQRPPRHPLPQTFEDLQALGLSARSWAALRDHTVWLPEPTPLNLNTAGVLALRAGIEGLQAADAQRLLQQRSQRPLDRPEALAELLPRLGTSASIGTLSVASRYFLVHGQLRLDTLTLQQTALLRRDGPRVDVVWLRRSPQASPSASAP